MQCLFNFMGIIVKKYFKSKKLQILQKLQSLQI
jgi:hypothetical protein